MAVLEQLRSTYPLTADILTAMLGGAFGICTIIPFLPTPLIQGALSAPQHENYVHPLRSRIISTLEKSPGIHFRELMRQLNAANGTLRHHLRVLTNEKTVTVVPVNGRTCYYAGAPAQVEILEGTGVTDEYTAASMLPVGLSTVQKNIVTRLSKSPNPVSQAQLARDLGRSRASVHSAVSVLRGRGILCESKISLAPHLESLARSKVDYPWLDIRKELA
ncbi:MAG: DNA-binding transcriptional ArsR family regulator [Candidatus Thalassarchaeaceae archaeon]|jgi:DNA-binding transcriptional ArsR family regulator